MSNLQNSYYNTLFRQWIHLSLALGSNKDLTRTKIQDINDDLN